MAQAIQHFKVDPILKIDETFYKQTEPISLRQFLSYRKGIPDFERKVYQVYFFKALFCHLKTFKNQRRFSSLRLLGHPVSNLRRI